VPRAVAVAAAHAALAVLALAPASVAAAVRLDARPAPDDRGVLEVVVLNTGDTPANALHPVVGFQHHRLAGAPVSLAPGTSHTWRVALPPLPGPGTFPAVVRTAGAPDAGAVVLVVPVSSPGAEPSPLRAVLEVEPVALLGHARLRLENPLPAPVAGRVVFVLPDGLTTEPDTQPAVVPAGGARIVPLVLEPRGVRPGTHRAFAVFGYVADGVAYAVVADAAVAVVPDGGRGGPPPLAIGLLALGAAVTVAVLAVRRTRSRRTAGPSAG
jgi:hypothetical protein